MAEMSMVEKVAKAMAEADVKTYEARHPNLSRDQIAGAAAVVAGDYLAMARAAIEAMKEPTLEMLESGHLAARSVRTLGVGGQTIEAQIRVRTQREAAAWRAMIDAALNGKEG